LHEVTNLLREPDRRRAPTPDMVRTLGASGLICPVVDSLSVRGVTGAVGQVDQALQSGEFRHMIVTSREAPPSRRLWEGKRRIKVQPLRPQDVPVFDKTYAPNS
jgi:hypothetical protein